MRAALDQAERTKWIKKMTRDNKAGHGNEISDAPVEFDLIMPLQYVAVHPP